MRRRLADFPPALGFLWREEGLKLRVFASLNGGYRMVEPMAK